MYIYIYNYYTITIYYYKLRIYFRTDLFSYGSTFVKIYFHAYVYLIAYFNSRNINITHASMCSCACGCRILMIHIMYNFIIIYKYILVNHSIKFKITKFKLLHNLITFFTNANRCIVSKS